MKCSCTYYINQSRKLFTPDGGHAPYPLWLPQWRTLSKTDDRSSNGTTAMLPESSGSEMLDKIMIIHELDPEFRKKIYRKKAQYDSKPDI